MNMYLIDKEHGRRKVCDRCHRVRVKIRKGGAVCVDCLSPADAARRGARQFAQQYLAVQAELRAERQRRAV